MIDSLRQTLTTALAELSAAPGSSLAQLAQLVDRDDVANTERALRWALEAAQIVGYLGERDTWEAASASVLGASSAQVVLVIDRLLPAISALPAAQAVAYAERRNLALTRQATLRAEIVELTAGLSEVTRPAALAAIISARSQRELELSAVRDLLGE